MTVLHIANINNKYKANGVNIVVPEHVKAQGKHIKTYFYNVTNQKIDGLENEQLYSEIKLFEKMLNSIEKIDLVVFHEIYAMEYIRMYKTLVRLKIPYIIIPHGGLHKQAQKKKFFKKFLANFLLFNAFVKKAKALQMLSTGELENTRFKNKKFIGTNGIKLPEIKKTKFNSNEIVYIGRLDAFIKGLDLLLKAIAIESDTLKSKNIKVHIYGPDMFGRLNLLRKIAAKEGVEDLVIFHDAIFNKEKEDVLLNCRFFIQTSRSEGMPLGILEALSYRIPCLVTKRTTLGGLIEHYNAGWVSQTNEEDIAKNIKKACEVTNLEILSENAINAIKENFLWDKVAKATIEEYKILVNAKNGI